MQIYMFWRIYYNLWNAAWIIMNAGLELKILYILNFEVGIV
jgi:hypothetical protein